MASHFDVPELIEPVKEGDLYCHLVAGEWSAVREASAFYDNINPADTTQVLGRVPESGTAAVDAACESAARAFEAWRGVSADLRTKALLEVANLLTEHLDVLCRIMTREMGKTLFDSRLDLLEAIGVVQAVAPMGLNLHGETYPTIARGVHMESRPEPRGVAAVITPFNFPVAIPIAQITAALVTGNTVVWKPSHLVPECSHALARIVTRALQTTAERWGADLPQGVFHMVQGDEETGSALVRNPHVMALSFTGSKKVGDEVDACASSLGKRVMRECGGVNIFYVHASARMDRAVRNVLYGKTITGGQRCTSVQEVLVDESVHDEFVEALVAGARDRIAMGPGDAEALAEADAAPDRFSLPPLVSAEQRERVAALLEAALEDGCRVLYRYDPPGDLAARGYFHPFVVLDDPGHDNVLRHTEVFGPVLLVRTVSGLDEAIRVINGTIGIVASFDATDKDVSETFIDRVLRTRIDDGRHGTGAFWSTKFGGDRGAGAGNPALDAEMVKAYVLWKTIYRAYEPKV